MVASPKKQKKPQRAHHKRKKRDRKKTKSATKKPQTQQKPERKLSTQDGTVFDCKIISTDDPLENLCVSSNTKNCPIPNYVFVPKGNVYITKKSKTLTQDAGLTVYIAIDPRTETRRGLYVPSPIYQQVLSLNAATSSARAAAVLEKDSRDLDKTKLLLTTLYPRMPSHDLTAVLAHAFRKGSKRVGRTTKISDKQRALLAVRAHVRHVHTDYEAMLKRGVGRGQARDQVQKRISEIVRSWGPVEGGKKLSQVKGSSPSKKVLPVVEHAAGWKGSALPGDVRSTRGGTAFAVW